MLVPVFFSAFNRDYKRALRRGKDPAKIKDAIRLLCAQGPLPASLRDTRSRANSPASATATSNPT